jgi:flagellar protein FliS
MSSYQEHALESASGVDLVVALYDGIIRFLQGACEAVDSGDVAARRRAVKRAMDIILHLQARLRMDVGGRPAQALSEFYASVFALILQGSQSASKARFEHAIECVRSVRDAWREVAREPMGNGLPEAAAAPTARAGGDPNDAGDSGVRSWSA